MKFTRILAFACLLLGGCVTTQTYRSFTYSLTTPAAVAERTDIARNPAETAIRYSATAPVIFDVRRYDNNQVLFTYTGTALDRSGVLPLNQVVWLRWRSATTTPAEVTYFPPPDPNGR